MSRLLYLCSCIFRVMTWWTSCSMSATVASGASVTQDRGTGFHLPTWIRPEHTHTSLNCENLKTISRVSLPLFACVCAWECVCLCVCTFSLRGRAVRVAQCQQGHLYQLVKQQISLDQHKLGVLFSPLSVHLALSVLHHAEHRQHAPWGEGDNWCQTAGMKTQHSLSRW